MSDPTPRPEDLFADFLGLPDAHSPESFERWVTAFPAQEAELRGLRRTQLALERRDDLEPAQPHSERYRSQGWLGSGGMAEVFRVHDHRLRRQLAMKVLARTDDDECVARFRDEAHTTAHLDHPGIVPIHDLGWDHEQRPFFTMKLVEGVDLATLLGEVSGRDRERRAAQVIARACDALAYAHARGIVHRDLKPSNIMVGRFGEVYVMDWGLALDARLRDKTPSGHSSQHAAIETQEDAVLGTPVYMSPEQIENPSTVDARADIYSVGAILYEALSGHPPYSQAATVSTERVLDAVMTGPPISLRTVARHTSSELRAISEKAMSHRPEDRYASVADLRQDLEACMAGRAVRAWKPHPLQRVTRWARRHGFALITLGSIAIGSAYGLARLARLNSELATDIAIENASLQASIVKVTGRRYNCSVSSILKTNGINRDPSDPRRPHGMPMSESFLRNLGSDISALDKGVQIRLYSDYPFLRAPRELDAFGRDALAALRNDPDSEFQRIEVMGGTRVVRIAAARVMQASCVDCHNRHPDSPKRDWRVGDVRGIVEVVQPAEMHPEEREAALHETFLTIAALISGAFGIAALLAWRGRRG